MAKNVLVVDDSTSVRSVVGLALRGAGYTVVEAGDGAQGLKQLESRRVHLIISDVHMPVMDGLTFLRHVRALPEHRLTPVMMLTTEAGESRRRVGQEQGAGAWMTKPFRPEQMLHAVHKLVTP